MNKCSFSFQQALNDIFLILTRVYLESVFNKIYVLNLGDNSHKTDNDLGNVFGIRVGVSINILVKTGKK